MEFTAHTSFGCFLVILFLVIPTPSSEIFTVHSPVGSLVALVGEEAKLHCYISPAKNAKHMEVHWYHEPFTKPLQLYKKGNDHYRGISLDNMDRTEILKEDIGKGNITLRIQNVSVSDGGKYRCLFKDGNFTEEAVLELKVLAPGLELEIEVKVNIIQGIEIKCFSKGWFPQPQMQWVNRRGELILPASKSESLDEGGLFHMHITLVLKQSQGMITCWLQHPVTGQEKKSSIQLADFLFQQHDFQKEGFYIYIVLTSALFVLYALLILGTSLLFKKNKRQGFKTMFSHVKVFTLLTTSSIICINILYAFVNFGIQGSQFPMKKRQMESLLLPTVFSIFSISVFTLLPFYWITMRRPGR